MPRLIIRNPYEFPAGRTPRINSQNPASRFLGRSGTTVGGGLVATAFPSGVIDLISGRIGTVTGSPSFGIHGQIGPALNNNVNSGITFAGGSLLGGSVTGVTHAMIIYPRSFTHTLYSTSLCAFGSTWMSISDNNMASGRLAYSLQGVTVNLTNMQLVVNTPYFIVAGTTASTDSIGFWLSRNLRTGVTQTDTVSGNIPRVQSTGLGTVYLAQSSANIDGFDGYMAAYMCNPLQGISLAEGMMWSEDPWSFWYPDV